MKRWLVRAAIMVALIAVVFLVPVMDWKYPLQRMRCRLGAGQACLQLATTYARGEHVRKNDRLAVEFFRRACDNRVWTGCTQLANHLAFGWGVEKNEQRAMDLYRHACEGRDTDACYQLGRAYHSGNRVGRDLQRAARLLEPVAREYVESCKSGDRDACMRAAVLHLSGEGVVRAVPLAVECLVRACRLGELGACTGAAYQYELGDGVTRDLRRAAELYGTGCEAARGGRSCCALARLRYPGIGLEPDRADAILLFEEACIGGEVHACAMTYANSQSVPEALARASRSFGAGCSDPYPPRGCEPVCVGTDVDQRARRSAAITDLVGLCEERQAAACYMVGLLLVQGVGLAAPDEGRGAAFLEASCDAGHAPGCHYLGTLYLSGTGVGGPDPARAQRLLRRACEAGYPFDCSEGQR